MMKGGVRRALLAINGVHDEAKTVEESGGLFPLIECNKLIATRDNL